MIIQKMKCPYGCESSTFLESKKTIVDANSKLLLDSNFQQNTSSVGKSVNVYVCNCCHNSFETPEQNSNNGKVVL